MHKILLLIIPITLLFSCANTTENEEGSVSEQHLSVEKFTDLLLDVQLIEGHLNVNRVNQVFVMDSAKNYYKEIFNRHGITLEDYKENMRYYTARPAVLEKVYQDVEERLVAQEALYTNVLIDQPAISPINRNQLIKVLLSDTGMVNYVLDTTVTYIVIKDSVFHYYNDSILKQNNTNELSFQQSFNVMTHTKPMFRMFKNELKNKLDEIKED